MTVPRAIWWVLLASFPPALLLLVRLNVGPPPSPEPIPIVIFVLCPGVVCMMGVFLWATPWISSELEGRSWVYPAVRPRGALAVMLGKYLVAVTWTLPAALLATTLGVLAMGGEDSMRILWVESRLVFLSCFSYGAVFTLIGVMFPKRAMVVGVFFAVLFEVVLASIPAAVNLLTIQFRLRCLGVRWMDWPPSFAADTPVFQAYFGDESAAWHLFVLFAMTIGLLAAAAAVLRIREFTAEAETDV
ncbi:MAG: hypothetical protein QF805_06710 [Pirellulaceae bacterium]|nr:hypothetical protein [Pirellulaceae bacterium]